MLFLSTKKLLLLLFDKRLFQRLAYRVSPFLLRSKCHGQRVFMCVSPQWPTSKGKKGKLRVVQGNRSRFEKMKYRVDFLDSSIKGPLGMAYLNFKLLFTRRMARQDSLSALTWQRGVSMYLVYLLVSIQCPINSKYLYFVVFVMLFLVCLFVCFFLLCQSWMWHFQTINKTTCIELEE